jgi:hypothetical protein
MAETFVWHGVTISRRNTEPGNIVKLEVSKPRGSGVGECPLPWCYDYEEMRP